jgi:rhodanese-related sulfurtransferase
MECIPGAIHASRGLIEFQADPIGPCHRPEFDPDQRVIVHSETGNRSALAALALQRLGYRRVAHLEGGLKAWKAAGHPIVHEA